MGIVNALPTARLDGARDDGKIQRFKSWRGEIAWRPKSSIIKIPLFAIICRGARYVPEVLSNRRSSRLAASSPPAVTQGRRHTTHRESKSSPKGDNP
jgi:hypothetical protein